mmetsp:Transcript_8600/g.39056  ORF Transcript_8600/g.39056 Transcript_8600/m.39056 type:complete len:369 (-) Transcript_8600:482-1588(-)
MAGLSELVEAATEGMRKTQSADPIEENSKQAPSATKDDGHLSDSAVAPTRERKKGVPWTEDEHRLFLLGLQKLGKGDWRGISRHFVQSRTPTQVASHAQKYFIRQNNLNKRKRRSSLFDIVSEAPAEPAKAPEVASKLPAGIPGGVSMAFAAGMPAFPGFNPASMPMPPGFGAHGAVPAAKKAGAGMDEGEKAAAATIAALAGSPIAAVGFAQAAAAATGSKGSNPWEVKHAPMVASPPGQHNAQQAAAAAAAAAANPFAAMMAMGAMGQMGAQMPPPAAWMQGYHQFMQQMAAAGAAHQQAQAARPPMPPPPAGVTFPPNLQGFTPGVFPGAHNVFGNFMNGAMAKPAGEKPETVAKKEGSATAVTA